MREETGGYHKATFEEVTKPFHCVPMNLMAWHELPDGCAYAVVMTCIQTKHTKLLMTPNRSVKPLTYAINALIAERGPSEVIYSEK